MPPAPSRLLRALLGLAWLVSVLASARTLIGSQLAIGHTSEFHAVRTLLVADLWRSGQLVPRWVPELSAGLGSPLFVYYGWLPYALSAALHLLGMSPVAAVNAVLVLALVVQSAGAWLLGRELGGRRGAWVSWALFAFAPYVLVNLYVRVNFPEVVAAALAPLAFACLLRAARGERRGGALAAAVVLALLILSHNLTAATVCTAAAAGAIGYALSEPRGTRLRAVGRVASALALALALSAFFWVPLVALRHEVQLHRIFTGYYDYSHHFVYPQQLFDHTWKYGISREGPIDGIPFPLGRAQVAAVLAAFGVAIARPALRTRAAGLALLALSLVALTTTLSAPIWRAVPALHVVHFPWLFFLPAELLIAAAGAVAADPVLGWLEAKVSPRAGWYVAPAVALAAAAFTAGYTHPRERVAYSEAQLRGVIDGTYLTTACADEYRPTGATSTRALNAVLGAEAASLDGVLHPEAGLPPWEARARFTLPLRADHAGELAIPVFYFPGWSVTVDGAPRPARACAGSGVLCLPVEAGAHEIRAQWGPPPLFRAAESASALTALAMLAYAAWARRARRARSTRLKLSASAPSPSTPRA